MAKENWVRNLLHRIILWALAIEEQKHDPAELDRAAAQSREQS